MKFRQIEYEVKKDPKLERNNVLIDDLRFGIVLYNLISNSVKHTNGGNIKVSIKLLNREQMEGKKVKVEKKRELEKQQPAFNYIDPEGSSSSDEDPNSASSFESRMLSTCRRGKEESENELPSPADLVDTQQQRKLPNRIYFISVSITDTGVGMSEYEQKNLFALFGNLRFRKNINQGGMGLGLTSANLICKVLNGNLNLIRSEKNNGSKFNFTM